MKDYLNGWQEESKVLIPSIPKGEEEAVVIREYIPPILPEEPEEVTTPLFAVEEPEGDDEPTTLLERKVKACVILKRESTGEITEVPEDSIAGNPFILGKGSDCDYIVKGNTSVSRRHAGIFREDGVWFLEDLESLNHTFVGDEEITGPVRLEDRMEIRLADETFLVTVEIRK